MRVLSFWMMFLPLDHFYSVNMLPTEHNSKTTYAFPLRMIQLQVALIYLVTGILKLMGSSWRSGDALYTMHCIPSCKLRQCCCLQANGWE
jgi:hypothetical protein